MAWKIELSPTAQRQIEKLDKPVANRILKFLRERVEKLDDPREIGARLQGPLSEFWRYRVGDYRIVCSLQHEHLVVLVPASVIEEKFMGDKENPRASARIRGEEVSTSAI